MDEPRTPKLRRIERQVDEQIRELRDSSELSGLPGEGVPLPPDPDADAGDAWAARHLSRGARARPAWAELREEIAEQRARLVTRLRAHDAWLDRRETLLERLPAERIVTETARSRAADERVRREMARAVDELNGLIRRHNLLVTASSVQLSTTTVDALIKIARAGRR